MTLQVTDLGIIGSCVFNYQESPALITKGNESQDQDNIDRANEVVQLLGGSMMSSFENQFPPPPLIFHFISWMNLLVLGHWILLFHHVPFILWSLIRT